MAEPLPKRALDSAVNPTEIAQQTFELERRGFDQRQVQTYLRAVADSLRDAQQRESEMRTRLGKAVRRAEAAEKAARDTPAQDPSELTRQIGDEVTTVLDAAHAAGEQRIAAAEKSAEQLMANAKSEATQIRGAAETIMDERRAEADAAATEILTQTYAEADGIRSEAQGEAEAMRTDAANRVAHARDECDALIREAEEARGQILEDMERRRRQARAQVERLRVGRDRLLRSYDVVRRTLEETTMELKSSLAEAKVRGDTAARLVAGEPLAERAQLEAELADAKLIGTVKVSGPKVLNSPALPRPLDPPQVPNIDLRTEDAPKPRKPKVAEAKKPQEQPKPPAVAPTLKATPVDESADAEPVIDAVGTEEPVEPIDAELAELEDDNLDVVEPCDEIEEVVALAAGTETATEADGTTEAPAVESPGIFAALRAQSETDVAEPDAKAADVEVADEIVEPDATEQVDNAAEMARQRDAVVAEAAQQIERRLKRALADEQNDLLAGIRAAKKGGVVLTDVVGDVDDHVARYVLGINEAALVAFGAGAALVDAEARDGRLPAGAVEEMIAAEVVDPIRNKLAELDALEVEAANDHLDPVRAFYRQRKTDHLGRAAQRLAQLLCVAGVCDGLPKGSPLPWASDE